jgi:hypothetical protein
MAMTKRGETALSICFIAFFVILIAFMLICQPKPPIAVANFADSHCLGEMVIMATHRRLADPLMMSLDKVEQSGSSMALTFTIHNDTNDAYTFVPDYVCCFGQDALQNGRESQSGKSLTVDAHSEATWTVRVDAILQPMTVCYLDLSNELIFSSWSIDQLPGRHKSEEAT